MTILFTRNMLWDKRKFVLRSETFISYFFYRKTSSKHFKAAYEPLNLISYNINKLVLYALYYIFTFTYWPKDLNRISNLTDFLSLEGCNLTFLKLKKDGIRIHL